MRKILIVFVAVFVALAAVPVEAQTTGTATVGGGEKRAWNLLSGHVWTVDGRTYINAGCQNIDPQPWDSRSTTVEMHVKIFERGQGSNAWYYSLKPGGPASDPVPGQRCDLSKGIDILTWELPTVLMPHGWETLPTLRLQIRSINEPAHLGLANNSRGDGRLYYNGGDNPYPGTGIHSRGEVVTEDELTDPGDYAR